MFCVKPTSLSKENSDRTLADKRTSEKRRRLTLEKAEEIHSGLHSSKKEKRMQSLDGLWYTLINSADRNTPKSYIENSEKAKDNVKGIVNNGISSYETRVKENIT